MTKRIGRDLFAKVMRMPSQDRNDILEFLGQSPVSMSAISEVYELRDDVSGTSGAAGLPTREKPAKNGAI
jgi:hypothetical protein